MRLGVYLAYIPRRFFVCGMQKELNERCIIEQKNFKFFIDRKNYICYSFLS